MTDDQSIEDHVENYVSRHDAKCGEIGKKLEEFINSSANSENIYHYTNDSGLYGIIESGEIWLGDVDSLNDPTELKHLVKLSIELLKGNLIKDRALAQLMSSYLESSQETGDRQANSAVFVASFSSKADDLDQWRAYADNGRGFSIGFDGKKLEEAFMAWCEPVSTPGTFFVLYDNHVACQYIESVVRVTEEFVAEALSSLGLESPEFKAVTQALISDMIIVMYSISTVFKNESYQNECEYRFLRLYEQAAEDMDASVRKGPYRLTRFIKFPWKSICPDALSSITAGPNGGAASQRFANDIKKQFKLDHVNINSSKIPYRG